VAGGSTAGSLTGTGTTGCIVFNNILNPAYGGVSVHSGPPTNIIELNPTSTPGHFYVTYAYGLSTSPSSPFVQVALQTSTDLVNWTTYNTYAIMVQNSFPIHTMSLTVTVTQAPTYIRLYNVRTAGFSLGFDGGTDASLTNCPMAYINVMQTD
jgi:hypothetical protein